MCLNVKCFVYLLIYRSPWLHRWAVFDESIVFGKKERGVERKRKENFINKSGQTISD